MTELVVHVGYPKTATTTLQMHLFPHHAEIDYLGKNFPGHTFRDPVLLEEFNRLALEGEMRYGGVAQLKALLAGYRAESRGKVVLVSTEALTHVAAVDAGLVARRLHEACAPCKILITIREQSALLTSFYAMHGRFGNYVFVTKEKEEGRLRFPIAADEWLKCMWRRPERNLPTTIHYHELIRYYVGLFGKANVGVFLFEELVHQPRQFLAGLCAFLGIDPDIAGALVSGKHENRRYSKLERLYQKLSRVLRLQGLDWTRAAAPSWLRRHAGLLGQERIGFGPYWSARVAELYREGNRRLMTDFGLPLDRYGYAA
jgi:hypothetical protein